jgi:AraC-like DNA-binding protein
MRAIARATRSTVATNASRAEGDADLARLATDLGFAHHSHFTARFRSIFCRTPRRARDAMISGRIRDLSTIMTADLDASP